MGQYVHFHARGHDPKLRLGAHLGILTGTLISVILCVAWEDFSYCWSQCGLSQCCLLVRGVYVCLTGIKSDLRTLTHIQLVKFETVGAVARRFRRVGISLILTSLQT
jgi:hypothetical protein